MEGKIVYFDQPGEQNTDEVLRLAKLRAEELGIKTILVASDSGDTAVKAVNVFQGLRVVVVAQSFGIDEPNTSRFTEENRKIVESKGGSILSAVHTFGGIYQAIAGARDSGGAVKPGEPVSYGDIIGTTLGFFGRGMKVACEIVLMAADAGLVRTEDEDVIAISGSEYGADTAIVVQPSNSGRFYNLRVKQIVCKPLTYPSPIRSYTPPKGMTYLPWTPDR